MLVLAWFGSRAGVALAVAEDAPGHDPVAQERYVLIEELMKVRRKERALMAERDAKPGAKGAYPARYTYAEEPFSIRRKEFWPLSKMEYLLSSFIPTLSHESDGLIFQVPGLSCMLPSACGALLLPWAQQFPACLQFRSAQSCC